MNFLTLKTPNIQLKLIGWCHLTGLEPYLQGSYEKLVVGAAKLCASEDSSFVGKPPATTYHYKV